VHVGTIAKELGYNMKHINKAMDRKQAEIQVYLTEIAQQQQKMRAELNEGFLRLGEKSDGIKADTEKLLDFAAKQVDFEARLMLKMDDLKSDILITKEALTQHKKQFDEFDTDGDGFVDESELMVGLMAHGMHEVERLLHC